MESLAVNAQNALSATKAAGDKAAASGMENDASGTGGATVQFIVILLGKEQYGVDIKAIQNIVRIQHITRVPNVISYLKGVINLRGEVIPVMSMRLKMGLEEDEITKNTRIIILKPEQKENIGVIVDEVKEVVTLKISQIEKVAYDSKEEKNTYINGIGKYEKGLLSLLDLNSINLDNNN